MTKAGVRLEVLLNATTRRDEQGNIIGVVGIGQDVSCSLPSWLDLNFELPSTYFTFPFL
jgi:hypothetical protein